MMARHRRPSWTGLPVQLDQREITMLPARAATQDGRITHWARIVAAGIGRTEVPLIGTPPFLARKGSRANTIQISRGRDGLIRFGVVTDVTDACAASRAAYRPKVETLALDFGLTRLFASDRGDLLGRDFLRRLIAIDATITSIGRHAQRAGTKLRDSARYRRHTGRMRGLVTTEVNRVLNRLVQTHAPSELLLEKLDFSSPTLSRRMNRLVSNCGRSVVRAKLVDLEQRFGIASDEVDSAYTSQRCSSCGHVHTSNRNGDHFQCRRCGLRLHADVNAARNIRQRRSLPDLDEAQLRPGSTFRSLRGRQRTLEALRQDFERRHPEEHRLRRWPGFRSRRSGPAADSLDESSRFAWDEVRCAA
jgi:putative transposase